jgi:hypothetical protein
MNEHASDGMAPQQGHGNVIEAPWLANGGHGASFRHHNEHDSNGMAPPTRGRARGHTTARPQTISSLAGWAQQLRQEAGAALDARQTAGTFRDRNRSGGWDSPYASTRLLCGAEISHHRACVVTRRRHPRRGRCAFY